MDPPPSTQLSEPPANIFYNSDGSPIGIFAEAGHIQHRPQLVRRLKRHGAVIRSDPKDAQIILVNPESTQGRIFARDWGNDINKVVLDSAWAGKCFSAEQALLEEDDYGGYLVLDDGRPIENDEDQESGDEISKSPLPTPRDTPVEPVKSVQPVKSAQPVQPYPKTKDTPYSIPASQQATRTSPDFPNASPSRNADVPQTPTFNGMDMATMAQFMQQFVPAAMAPTPQMPLMMNQQQAAMLQILSNGFQFPPPQQHMQNDPFWLAVHDTMVNKGFYPSQTQPPPMPLSHAYPQSLPISPVEQQVLPFPPIPPPGESASKSSAKTKGKQRAVSPPAKRRKTSSSAFQEAVPKASKPNSTSMGPPSERKIFTASSGNPMTFFVQVGGHNRFSLVQSIKKNGGTIVTNVNDADYVVLFPPSGSKTDKTQESFLSMAHAAGQPAVSARFVNDCLEQHKILDTEPYEFSAASQSKRKRTSSTLRSGSPIEPESEDEDDEQSPILSQAQIASQQAEESERKRLEKNKREQERRRRLRDEREVERDVLHSSRPESPFTEPSAGPWTGSPKRGRGRPRKTDSLKTDPGETKGPPSPTAPGKTAQAWGKGFKFSPEENAFAINYGKILIERDHELSLSNIASAIYEKLPHHTLRSWRTHLPSLPGFDLDEWRKRAGIAFRKAQNLKQTSTTPMAPSPAIAEKFEPFGFEEYSEPPSTVMSPSPIAPAAAPNTNDTSGQTAMSNLEDDLVVIADFFAAGNDDQTETEEAIWAKLTAQAKCKTENNWEEFYQKNSDEVQRRYQSLVDVQANKGH